MGKFLGETLNKMALQAKGHNSKSASEFSHFFEKMRSSGELVSNEEILKYSQLFKDDITLESLSQAQLKAICQIIEVQNFGTHGLLQLQIEMKLRSLSADDRLIKEEGVDSLSAWELQQACRQRGMRAYGMTDEKLRSSLEQWLELSLDKKVPPSLLLLSRAFYLPDDEQALAHTISNLPDEVCSLSCPANFQTYRVPTCLRSHPL